MKCMPKYLKNRKNLIFLDLEGTQFSHELIALGAVRVLLNDDFTVRKIKKEIKYYVKPKKEIGRFVIELTGITPEKLNSEGISFKEALKFFKKFCGFDYQKCMFLTFGSHDLRIFQQSLLHSSDGNEEIVRHIGRNFVDVSAVLSQFIKDDKNNPLSLINYMKLFDIPRDGEHHDPLSDARYLVLLYDAMMKRSDILCQEYYKVLNNMRLLPEPVKHAVSMLVNDQIVTPEEFKEKIKEFIG